MDSYSSFVDLSDCESDSSESSSSGSSESETDSSSSSSGESDVSEAPRRRHRYRKATSLVSTFRQRGLFMSIENARNEWDHIKQ
jgi:hypothetical protein